MKNKAYSILLLGLLSMLFAEIFSGASQLWFLSLWGWFVTLPLYMMHIVFLFFLAYRTKKVSIKQLYLFGMIFGLYEALITKVLWFGYFNETGPTWGTFLGLAVNEFPMLVFFWHPIFSFILPILAYEIITKKQIISHHQILKRSKMKNVYIGLVLLGIPSFIVNGNAYNIVSANGAFIGTLFLIWLVYGLLKKKPLQISHLKSIRVSLWVLGLILLYGISFKFLLTERIPDTIMPYLSVFAFYVIAILLLKRTMKGEPKEVDLDSDCYQMKDLMIFSGIILILINIFVFIPDIANGILFISYLGYFAVGVVLFISTVIKVIFHKKAIGLEEFGI